MTNAQNNEVGATYFTVFKQCMVISVGKYATFYHSYIVVEYDVTM